MMTDLSHDELLSNDRREKGMRHYRLNDGRRDEIARQIDQFIASGGSIVQLPIQVRSADELGHTAKKRLISMPACDSEFRKVALQ